MLKKIIKKVTPSYLLNIILKMRQLFNFYTIKIMRKNNLLSYLSLIMDRNYIYEHRTFLNGSYQYEKAKLNYEGNIYNLRRNIHRLEKGLLMKPMRNEFGLSFIENTVKNFINLDHEKYPDISLWGNNILSEYFQLTKSDDKKYANAKKLYENINIKILESNYLPYRMEKTTTISYENFKEMNLLRKSTRWFNNMEVEKEKLLKALDIARLAPSGCNRQPYRYVVTNDLTKAKILANISGGTGGWSHNIPAIAIVIGKQSSFTGTLNRHSIYIDSTLTIMPFVLALETLGLSSCIINWVDITERINKMKKEFKIEDDECIITSIAIGYADKDGKVAYSKRMDIENLVEFI